MIAIKFQYRYPLPPHRSDLDEHRRRAIRACYEAALKEDRYPVTKPVVEIEAGETRSLDYLRPVLLVTVECL